MDILRLGFTSFLSCLLVWTPYAANAQSAVASQPPADLVAASKDLFGSLGGTVQGRMENNVYRAQITGEKINYTLEIPKSEAQEVRRFSPKEVLKHFVVSPTLHAAYRFPQESMLFFAAIGGVVALQLFTDYSANPLRAQQHIEHSLSPMGMFSFFTFMAANGVASNVATTFIKNPAFQHFIPYMGMTVGFFAQSALTPFLADPNVYMCAASWIGKGEAASDAKKEQSSPACEKAYERWAVGNLFYELTPGLISMVTSTLLAGVVQRVAIAGVLRLTGFDLAPLFLPGGVAVFGIRAVLASMVQMGLFYYIDNGFLNRRITFAWKNTFDGSSLNRIEYEITQNILWKKRNGWADVPAAANAKPKDKHDLGDILKELHQKMGDWRMLNLTEVYEAHQAWQERLASLNSQFNAAFEVDREFVNEIRKTRFQSSQAADRRLEALDHLYGVTPKDLPKGKDELLYSRAAYTENLATTTASEVGAELRKKIDSGDYAKTGTLMPNELNVLQQIATKLVSDPSKGSDAMIADQGQALDILNHETGAIKYGNISQDFYQLLQAIKKALGPDPRNLAQAGRGFFLRMENFSSLSSEIKAAAFANRQIDSNTAYLVQQAACGPDTEEGLVTSARGFKASFTPPRLVKEPLKLSGLCYANIDEIGQRMIFGAPFDYQGKKYQSVLDYVVQNIDPEILGTKEHSGFADWWTKKTDAQMQAAYRLYEAQYEEIVIKMVRAFLDHKDSAWNIGPVATNPIDAIRQQMRLDLMVAGEMLKDLYVAQYKTSLPKAAFNSRPEPQPPVREAYTQGTNAELPGLPDAPNTQKVGLLTLLRVGGVGGASYVGTNFRTKMNAVATGSPMETSVFEWDRLLAAVPGNVAALGLKQPIGYALQAQKEIEYEMEKLIWMLSRIRIVKVDNKAIQNDLESSQFMGERVRGILARFHIVPISNKSVQSDLENVDLADQVDKVSEKLTQFSNLFDAGETKNANSLIKNLTPGQRETIVTAMEGLQMLAHEVSLYGQIANAVSWDKIRNLKAASAKQQAYNEKVQQRINELTRAYLSRMGGAH